MVIYCLKKGISIMTELRKASKQDWLKNFSEILADSIDCGFDERTAIEISRIIVNARKDIEPYTGYRAALASKVTVIKGQDGRIKTTVDINLNLVPEKHREVARKHFRDHE
jgi:hypothetical protein